MATTYFVAEHQTERRSQEHRRIIGLLDENGYCAPWIGSPIGDRLDGQACYLLDDTEVIHNDSHFTVVASSRERLDKAAKLLGIQIGQFIERGPRAMGA